jgi:hypothetical protein
MQFLESQIMVRTLLDLKEREIVALPIHDAIIVPGSRARAAAGAMKGAFEDIVGGRIPVTGEAWCPRSPGPGRRVAGLVIELLVAPSRQQGRE